MKSLSKLQIEMLKDIFKIIINGGIYMSEKKENKEISTFEKRDFPQTSANVQMPKVNPPKDNANSDKDKK